MSLYFFQVLPVVIFFSSFISVMYYLGAMQVLITKMAWGMQVTMGTTAAESMNAAANIFLGQVCVPLFPCSEKPILIVLYYSFIYLFHYILRTVI